MTGDEGPFWERREQVETFAARPADERLAALVGSFAHPAATRVLDLGCAGGRNAALLAEHGFDLWAIDASTAMVRHTRERVAAFLGGEEAARRVRIGRMDDLSAFDAATFELVVALGILHNARDRAEWDRTLSETARVLAPGGLLLVAVFSPGSDPAGCGVRPVAGEPHVYQGFESGRMFLLETGELDAELARFALEAVQPAQRVVTATEKGQRVTANGLYRRTGR
jgi:SAM-dependent methyltransferase